MDEMKKTSDDARTTIRWLEQEFTIGSRFIRLQRNNESMPISLIKIPKKLGMQLKLNCIFKVQLVIKFLFIFIFAKIDREAAAFIQIAQFCNFMNESYFIKNGDAEKSDGVRPNIVTFLTGDKLGDKTAGNLSYTGLLNAGAINFEQITTFYANFKKK